MTFSLQCDNPITYYRWVTYNTKEPETLDWIDRYIKEGDIVFDVGANIGVYSIYAALRHPGARIVAFEPEYANLHFLRDNVIENRVMDRVSIYPLALSDRSGPSMLHLQDLTPGAALATEASVSLNMTRSGKRVIAREGTYALTLDEFCSQTRMQPNGLKIDVDGTEPEILAGATDTLSHIGLRSVIVEIPEGHSGRAACARSLENAGLRLEWQATESPNQIWRRPAEGAS